MEEQNKKGTMGAVALAACCAAIVIPTVVVAVGTTGGLVFALVKLKRFIQDRFAKGNEVSSIPVSP
ncbi:MAG: hypothetical protein D6732_17100 [Methanobacteriota archaeon]|nr:MAG: hypothetical protein D6732_17100 [Euryarchaeota archaeon]